MMMRTLAVRCCAGECMWCTICGGHQPYRWQHSMSPDANGLYTFACKWVYVAGWLTPSATTRCTTRCSAVGVKWPAGSGLGPWAQQQQGSHDCQAVDLHATGQPWGSCRDTQCNTNKPSASAAQRVPTKGSGMTSHLMVQACSSISYVHVHAHAMPQPVGGTLCTLCECNGPPGPAHAVAPVGPIYSTTA